MLNSAFRALGRRAGVVCHGWCQPAHSDGPRTLVVFKFQRRLLSSYRLNRHLNLLTNQTEPLSCKKDLSVEGVSGSRPITIMLPWLNSKKKSIEKYASFYLDQGIDVLSVTINALELLRPTKGSQVAAAETLRFLHANPVYNNVVVHGFSVGAYVFAEVIVQIMADPGHKAIADKIIGRVWDSPVAMSMIPDGIPLATTDNLTLRKMMKSYILFHLRAFENSATRHYRTAQTAYEEYFIDSPMLFLYSKDDPVVSENNINIVANHQERHGLKVFIKCWDKSSHVSHLKMHPKDYRAHLSAFLQVMGLLNYPERFQLHA